MNLTDDSSFSLCFAFIRSPAIEPVIEKNHVPDDGSETDSAKDININFT